MFTKPFLAQFAPNAHVKSQQHQLVQHQLAKGKPVRDTPQSRAKLQMSYGDSF